MPQEWQKSLFIQPAIVLIAFARRRCCVQRTWSLKKSTSPMTQHREPKWSVCPPGEPYRRSLSIGILSVVTTRPGALTPPANWIVCWGDHQKLAELGRAKQCWASLGAAVWSGNAGMGFPPALRNELYDRTREHKGIGEPVAYSMPVPSKKFVTFSNEGSGDSTRKWIRHPTRPTDPSIGIAKRCVTMHSAHRFPTKQA